jgi:phosphoribosyl 1,2-cyclic phosphate phosphodiesterase
MKLKILGSAAAEGIPALWCECKTCENSLKKGGKNIRRRTSYLIDDDTIIDFGPDIFYQMMSFNIDLSRIKRIIFTHSHSDHLNPVDLEFRRKGLSLVSSSINVFANSTVLEKIIAQTGESFDALKIVPVPLDNTPKFIDEDLEIYALPAFHCLDSSEQAFNYVIGRNSKYILIANDTGWWHDVSWEKIKDFKLSAAIIECTMGIDPLNINSKIGHLGANISIDFRDKLCELGAVSDITRVYVNHFSHNGKALHEDLCDFFEPYGIGVGYDGLCLDF